MTVRVYKSTDAGAPTQFGGAGTVIGILDACLVNGYGSKPAAGWTKPFSGTNLAVYKGVGANAKYLRIDDTTTTSGLGALAAGYQTMSGVSTGTGKFPPTSSILPNGYHIHRYYTATGATADTVPWVVVAKDNFFWFMIGKTLDITFRQGCSYLGFGEITSNVVGDINNTIIMGPNTSNAGNTQVAYVNYTTFSAAESSCINLATDYTGIVAGAIGILHSPYVGATEMGHVSRPEEPEAVCPSPVSHKVPFYPLNIYEKDAGYRGRLPGFFHVNTTTMYGANYKALSEFSIVGGRTFILMPWANRGLNTLVALETSDTW